VIAAAVEPPPTPWQFPTPTSAPDDLVCLGADLEPGTILAAYRAGLFPMPYDRRRLGWWSPDPRGLLPLDGLRITRSLRRSMRRYEVRIDTAFVDIVTACASVRRRGGWITPPFIAAYGRLHELGWTHSVETWTDDGELAGGLYGVAIGGLFAGESMFHRQTDASKVALVALVDHLQASGMSLLDVQWLTPHLATLGATEVPRARYLALLQDALAVRATFRTQFAHG
jgi:leucyl/phenylalanyl-tRNA--protein transferase